MEATSLRGNDKDIKEFQITGMFRFCCIQTDPNPAKLSSKGNQFGKCYEEMYRKLENQPTPHKNKLPGHESKKTHSEYNKDSCKHFLLVKRNVIA